MSLDLIPEYLQSLWSGLHGSQYMITRWIFLRALGFIYLIAFVSIWVQIKGLIGSMGILPIEEYLSAVKASHPGLERFHLLPTVFWFGASDMALYSVCALGVLASVALIGGIAPMMSLFVLWLLYLSIVIAGQDFLSFQWDIFLLEVGFLSIFLAPWGLHPSFGEETIVSPVAMVLLWILLCKFMFESGVVKLNSGDSSWTDLTALTYHYFTQPLPTWTSFFVHHMPLLFHKLSTLFMFAAEIILPLLIFATRPLRIIACVGMILLQVIIFATGNYTFFNFLSIALCLLLLDDTFWISVLPQSFLSWLGDPAAVLGVSPLSGVTMGVAVIFLCMSAYSLLRTFHIRVPLGPLRLVVDVIQPFHTFNSYGLFRVMTKTRPEIIVEGSNDGTTWKAYEFRYKPGDVRGKPQFVEPHQPRLDWQMWFAALSNFNRTPWFQNFLVRLLQGSPDVLDLLANNPFPNAPPKHVRALLYEYTFSDSEVRRKNGEWWQRTLLGAYSPILTLK